MAAVLVDACSFSSPCPGVILSELLCWTKNLLLSYGSDRVAKLLVAFCKLEVLLKAETEVSAFVEAMGEEEKRGAPSLKSKRTASRAVDYVDGYKIASRLVEAVEWLVGKAVKICAEDLAKLPPVSFGLMEANLFSETAERDTSTAQQLEEAVKAIDKKIDTLTSELKSFSPATSDRVTSFADIMAQQKLEGAPAMPESGIEWSPLSCTNAHTPLMDARKPPALRPRSQPSGRPPLMGKGTSEKLKSTPLYYTLSVRRISLEDKEEDVTAHMVSMGVTPKRVSILPKRWEEQYTQMARVVVSMEDKEAVLQAPFWPKGYLVKEWFFKPHHA